MRKSLSSTSQSQSNYIHSTAHNSPSPTIQDGSPACPESRLLALPQESLGHISAFLDPPALFALGRACKALARHVADDGTWRRAFAYHFLGRGPEHDLDAVNDDEALTLRRSEPTWKREFVLRFQVRTRWLRSRASTITHSPTHTAISSILLLSDPTTPALLSVSLAYGIVARSYPLIGRVLRGILNAHGTHHAFPVAGAAANPNADFAPDVTVCAVALDPAQALSGAGVGSSAASARVLWARRDGAIAVMSHPRTMAGPRAAAPARVGSSTLVDEHHGAVTDAIFCAGPVDACVSAGMDGRVKVWAVRRFGCIWTSPLAPVSGPLRGPIGEEPLTIVREDLARAGVIACATERGAVIVYTGLDLGSLIARHERSLERVPVQASQQAQAHVGQQQGDVVRMYRIAPPEGDAGEVRVAEMFIDNLGSQNDVVTLLVRRAQRAVFYRYDIDTRASTGAGNSGQADAASVTTFGDTADGAKITALCPVFSDGADEPRFVIAGTELGSVSVYRWNLSSSSPSSSPISPARRADVFPPTSFGSAITALAFHAHAIAVGSASGAIRVLDVITLVPLRAFAAPSGAFSGITPNGVPVETTGVRQIVLQRDMLVAAVGSKIVAWKSAPVVGGARGKSMHGKVRAHSGGNKTNGERKWEKQIALRRDIAESRDDIEDILGSYNGFGGDQRRRGWGQDRAQAALGLNEREAVEYALMLSRDEALASTSAIEEMEMSAAVRASVEEGVFELDDGVSAAASSTDHTESLDSSPPLSLTPSPALSPALSSSSSFSPSISPSSALSPSRSFLTRSTARAIIAASSPDAHTLERGKVRLSPRVAPEPMEAGGLASLSLSASPLMLPTSTSNFALPTLLAMPSLPSAVAPSLPAGVELPAMASSAGSSSAWPLTPARGSPPAPRGVWTTPLRTPPSSVSASPPAAMQARHERARGDVQNQGHGQQLQDRDRDPEQQEQDVWSRRAAEINAIEDDELRFVLELSLAEEQSRMST